MLKKLKLINQILFIILFMCIYVNLFTSGYDIFLKLFCIILFFLLLTVLEIKKEEKIVYDNKYNILILLYNSIIIVFMLNFYIFYKHSIILSYAPCSLYLDYFLYTMPIPLIYNLLNIESYKNLFRKKIENK